MHAAPPTARTPRADQPAAWTIVVPFKGGDAAKSRLGRATARAAGIHPAARRRLALAFLRDTVAAAAAVHDVGAVVVVSSDPAVGPALPGTVVVPDPGGGLNAAAAAGIAWACAGHGGPVAVLTGDLPCLLPADLSAALDLARRHPLAVVPDHLGSGSTLITAQPGVPLVPHFGGASCRAHRRAGHAVLSLPSGSTVRHDVDTADDLDRALRRGAGMRTELAFAAPRRTTPEHGFAARVPLAPLPAAV